MKQLKESKYETKFNRGGITKVHQGTYPFVKGNDLAPLVINKLPAYKGSGRPVEYKRVLPPMRDRRDIDLEILAQVLTDVLPEFDYKKINICNGICSYKHMKFRYKNLVDLLYILRQEKAFDCNDRTIDSLDFRYNAQFQTKRQKHE